MLPEWPRAYGKPPVTGIMREAASDFDVEELLGFEPDGAGEHCWLWIEKTDLNTADAAQRLARFAGLRERDISYSGLKDKRAVARQWFSLHLLNREPSWVDWSDPALQILRVARHSKKLRRGTHRSNRFVIVLRGVEGDTEALRQRVERIARAGVPNYFGEQRFGRDGRNLELARRAAAERKSRLPRQQAGLYLSAARSYLFNAILAQRVAQQNWQSPLAGEVFVLNRSKSTFKQPLDDVLTQRLDSGDIHLSAAMPGRDAGLQPEDEVVQLEAAALAEHADLVAFIAQAGVDAERRSMRLIPESFRVDEIGERTWRFCFDLPKGCFATSLMRELADYSVPNRFAETVGEEPWSPNISRG